MIFYLKRFHCNYFSLTNFKVYFSVSSVIINRFIINLHLQLERNQNSNLIIFKIIIMQCCYTYIIILCIISATPTVTNIVCVNIIIIIITTTTTTTTTTTIVLILLLLLLYLNFELAEETFYVILINNNKYKTRILVVRYNRIFDHLYYDGNSCILHIIITHD